MNRRLLLLTAVAACVAALPAHASDYPNRAIELIVPYNAGGGTDALARAFADVARKHLSQPIVVNNKPGASGVIGWSDVLNSKANGETKMGNSGNGSIWHLAAAALEDKSGATCRWEPGAAWVRPRTRPRT